MNVYLMHKDRDFDPKALPPWNAKELEQDLELETLFNAMAREDEVVLRAVRSAILNGATDLETIRYRQHVLTDCIDNPEVIRELYRLTLETIEKKNRSYLGLFSRYYPSSILHGSVELLHVFLNMLKQLRTIAEGSAGVFRSEGFASLFAMLKRELSDDYLAEVLRLLKELRLRAGALVSARLNDGNKGADYVLRRPNRPRRGLKRIFERAPAAFGFRIADRDESGARALSEMKDRGINPVANALAQSSDHVVSFFNVLRTELAFYIGCLNLRETLTLRGFPLCIPDPLPARERTHAFEGLYDPSLALTAEGPVIGNDMEAEEKDLVFITGANRGGKSTFLRSVGLAQLLMQCGMFVPAASFRANICRGVFTHYGREEDETMKSGKFDEELGRMSRIVDGIGERSLVLFNESFSATNEREGSEIARQIVTALLEKGVKVFYVTHMYELAGGFHRRNTHGGVFLRAERLDDGTRTYRMIEGEPLQTSYGRDMYEKIFETEEGARSRSPRDEALVSARSVYDPPRHP